MRTKTNFLQAKKKRAANFLHVTWQAKFLGNLLLNVYVRFVAVHIHSVPDVWTTSVPAKVVHISEKTIHQKM